MGLVLQTSNLTKKYGKQIAIDNVNINIEKGDIYGLIGKNGSGKSTTIKAILGLINPTAGKVTVMGEDSTKLSCKCSNDLTEVILSH